MKDIEAALKGSIYFWKYKTDGWLGSEWHFSATKAGRCSFVVALHQLGISPEPASITIPITPVPRRILKIPDFNSPHENRDVLKIMYDPVSSHNGDWAVSDNEHVVEIMIGKNALKQWLRLIEGSSDDDRAIGFDDDHTVFVW